MRARVPWGGLTLLAGGCEVCSIYGGMRFADEDLSLKCSRGTVAMANAGDFPCSCVPLEI